MVHVRRFTMATVAAAVIAGAPVAAVPQATDIPAQTRTAIDSQPRGEAARESWQRVPDIFAAMRVTEGAVVADIGAGGGFFTTRLAKAVGPRGRVYAVDISPAALNGLRLRLDAEGVTNVETILGSTDDPKLPAERLDAVLIVNAYHEMREHQAMLAAIKRALKPSGRLVIVEPVMADARTWPRTAQEARHQIAPVYLQQDALAAGFVIADLEDPFTERGGHTTEYLVSLAPVPPTTTPPAGDPGHAASVEARRPDEVVAAVRLAPGQTVIDIGAGSGVFTRRFAAAVGPRGRAIGLDIDPAAVAAMQADARASGLSNYEARLVAPDDPAIPRASADVIFLSNAYHHLENRVAYFTRVRDALKPGGRIVIVDFPPAVMGGNAGAGHPDRQQVERELASAGFRLLKEHGLLERQFFLEFVRAR